jgi:hypothetical protein
MNAETQSNQFPRRLVRPLDRDLGVSAVGVFGGVQALM